MERGDARGTHDEGDAEIDRPPADDDHERALARVRHLYHEGSQPLTVARARYQLLQQERHRV